MLEGHLLGKGIVYQLMICWYEYITFSKLQTDISAKN